MARGNTAFNRAPKSRTRILELDPDSPVDDLLLRTALELGKGQGRGVAIADLVEQARELLGLCKAKDTSGINRICDRLVRGYVTGTYAKDGDLLEEELESMAKVLGYRDLDDVLAQSAHER